MNGALAAIRNPYETMSIFKGVIRAVIGPKSASCLAQTYQKAKKSVFVVFCTTWREVKAVMDTGDVPFGAVYTREARNRSQGGLNGFLKSVSTSRRSYLKHHPLSSTLIIASTINV